MEAGCLRRRPRTSNEKPAIEQILDILLQRGQITQEEYRSLQEKVRLEQAAGKPEQGTGIQAGIERGRPFFQSADGNFRVELGGRLHVDYDAAEGDARTLTGSKLGN